MEFNSNKAIYLQISDIICEKILSGELKADDRIPSVREYGASIGVNPNTVMRTYEKLTNEGIIYNKRGIGYFVAEGARRLILSLRKQHFMDDEAAALFKQLYMLGISDKELADMYRTYIQNHHTKEENE